MTTAGRFPFGQGAADFLSNIVGAFYGPPVPQAITLWSDQSVQGGGTGGVRYVDLLLADGVTAVTFLTSGVDGSYPGFYPPVGVRVVWADAGGPRRFKLLCDFTVASDATYDPIGAGAGAAAAIAVLPSVAARFAAPTADVALYNSGGSPPAYLLGRHLGAQRHERWRFEQTTPLSGNAAPWVTKLNGSTIDIPMNSRGTFNVGKTAYDPAVTVSGTGWAGAGGGLTNVLAFNGAYDRGTATGAAIHFTTPSTTATRAALRHILTAACGFGLVSIDGDNTLANLVPTAAQWVATGLLAATALIANGGTLNPTDRLINFYAAATIWDVCTLLADNLQPATHVVVITTTGFKQAAATDIRCDISGFMYADQSMVATAALAPVGQLLPSTLQWATLRTTTTTPMASERAINTLPTGATTPTFTGTDHGYEDQDSLVATMDGTVVAPTSGQVVTGKSLVITVTSHLWHPDLGRSNTVATVVTTYTMGAPALLVSETITWLIGGTSAAAFLGMLTTYGAVVPQNQAWLNRGKTDTSGVVITLNAEDDGYKTSSIARAAWVWEQNGCAATLVAYPDAGLNTNKWARSNGTSGNPQYLAIQDRNIANSLGHKVYPPRISGGNSETIAIGDVWQAQMLYATQWFTAGAEAVLATA